MAREAAGQERGGQTGERQRVEVNGDSLRIRVAALEKRLLQRTRFDS